MFCHFGLITLEQTNGKEWITPNHRVGV